MAAMHSLRQRTTVLLLLICFCYCAAFHVPPVQRPRTLELYLFGSTKRRLRNYFSPFSSSSSSSKPSVFRRLIRRFRKPKDKVNDSPTLPIRIEDAPSAELEAVSAVTATLLEEDEARSLVASPAVDLTGDWKLIVSDVFKQEYDEYLKKLDQPFLVRSVALAIISLTTEATKQTEDGRDLWIKGTNPRGVWERTLTTSQNNASDLPTIYTIDNEPVECEAWWENGGTVHRSWLRGVTLYGGGSFESKRYLDGDVYVCESAFHPNDSNRSPAQVTWRFERTTS